MKISIVTPTYNSAAHIRETMESIHTQSYTNFEHFVIDGLSADPTASIIKNYPNATFISEKDKGQSDAINKGFKLVTGDILAWQNADDTYLPHTFALIADFFSKNKEVDFVYGNYQLIDSCSKKICDVYPIEWNEWMFAHGRFCPLQPTVFWRKTAMEKVGVLDESLHYCMDVDLFSRMLKQGLVFKKIPHILGQFRIHVDSKTQNSSNEEKVKKEYRNALARNFNYNSIDYFFFEIFHWRAKLAKAIKTKSFLG